MRQVNGRVNKKPVNARVLTGSRNACNPRGHHGHCNTVPTVRRVEKSNAKRKILIGQDNNGDYHIGLVKPTVLFSVESIKWDIAHQNWAGKPCVKAWLVNNKIVYRTHIFHR